MADDCHAAITAAGKDKEGLLKLSAADEIDACTSQLVNSVGAPSCTVIAANSQTRVGGGDAPQLPALVSPSMGLVASLMRVRDSLSPPPPPSPSPVAGQDASLPSASVSVSSAYSCEVPPLPAGARRPSPACMAAMLRREQELRLSDEAQVCELERERQRE